MKYISIVLLLLVNNIHANNSINQKGVSEVIGIAKNSSVNGTQVTYDFYLENLGSISLSNIQISEDLDSVFGNGNFTIISGPTLIDNPATITLNAAFNGSGDTSLIASASLFTLDTAQIRIVVDVTTTTDQGLGFGIYSNQVTITSDGLALNPSDVSDSGTDPDPDGDADPNEPGENDPTITDLSTTPVELLQFEID